MVAQPSTGFLHVNVNIRLAPSTQTARTNPFLSRRQGILQPNEQGSRFPKVEWLLRSRKKKRAQLDGGRTLVKKSREPRHRKNNGRVFLVSPMNNYAYPAFGTTLALDCPEKKALVPFFLVLLFFCWLLLAATQHNALRCADAGVKYRSAI